MEINKIEIKIDMLFYVIGIVLIALKLDGILKLKWIQVLIPFLIPTVTSVIAIFIYFIVKLFMREEE